ncbi:MAG: ABC transporter substrate-binding protein [Rhodospirillaceae bacterium]|nr:ABC transporter substrate-binding protein [Rhodospirillaceae bacterium]
MSDDLKKIHPYLPKLLEQFRDGKVDRREFLRTSTLLGLSAGTAFTLAGCDDKEEVAEAPAEEVVEEEVAEAPAEEPAAPAAEKIVRISMRVPAVDNPPTYSWVYDSNITRQVCDYLTRTGTDNVTRPWLLESWEATEDIKTWTLHLKQGIKWSNGDELTADHVIWNLNRWLDESVGSSVLGLMKGYMLVEFDTGETNEDGSQKMSTRLWADNAIEKVDEYTVRLNCQEPQLAVPEHLFHYPALILHPSENGVFGVGSIGTGAFSLTELEVGKKAVLRRRDGYWGNPVKLDAVEFIDHGDDAAAAVQAIASQQVDGMYEAQTTQYAALQKIEHVQVHQVATGQTAIARMQPIHADMTDPSNQAAAFADPRVGKAMRLALDTEKLLQVGHLGLGLPGEHHHVCPIHPEYAKLEFMKQDIEGAKALLAEAGYPNGFNAEIFCKSDPDWEPITVQAMAEMWKQVGANIKINVLPSSQYWDIWNAPTAPFAFTSWTHRPLGVMVLGLAYRSGVPWNEAHWSNAEFDALLAKAEGTLDVEARRTIMIDIETLMQEVGPACQPLWRAVFTVMAKRVTGFEIHPTYYLFAEEWDVTA